LTPSQVLNSNLFELNRGTFDPRAAAAAMLAAAAAAAASGFDPGATGVLGECVHSGEKAPEKDGLAELKI
jgi:hypothetical protein